jgi:hypothetical protein
MSNTIRIRTTPNGGDKYLKLKLDQKFDFIEILSLKISQEDAYRKFCSDYGVVVGRVVVNSGFGVPNAKVSVFIPLDEIDKEDSNIRNLYPYEIVTDKDIDGIRYNLLPKEVENNNPCFTPVGTFPTKREILDNNDISHIYCKYYKFTTTTNYAGDFMLFGVPVGTHIIHADVDISDIGTLSQRPYDLIAQGAPEKLFESPTKFAKNKNLNKLPQIKTYNIGVNVQPFWGDLENCEVGITRVDIDLNYTLTPSAIFMGSIFGDQDKDSVNKNCRPRKKTGELCQQVSGEGSIEILRKTLEGDNELFFVNGGNVIDENGAWAFQIPMNLDYVVTDEEGNLIPSDNPNIGIPTRARVRFRIGMNETGDLGRVRTRAKYLVPNNPLTQSDIDYSFDETTVKESSFRDLYWNKIYTVSNFIPRYQKINLNLGGGDLAGLAGGVTGGVTGGLAGSTLQNLDKVSTRNFTGIKNVDGCVGDKNPFPFNRINTNSNPIFSIICLIIKIISFLISFLNSFIIPLINSILGVIYFIINGIIGVLNSIANIVPGVNNPVDPIQERFLACITVECPSDSGQLFAPGCNPDSVFDGGTAYNAAGQPQNACETSVCLGDTAGLDDCVAFQMAKALNLYEFDFYNDWINGTLYSYLVKYKFKPLSDSEKYCDNNCSEFGDIISDVDSNLQNKCTNQELIDTLYPNNTQILNTQQNNFYTSPIIREGLIKKNEETLYYASVAPRLMYRLFATDIVTLGSVFDCDWQGIPKIQQYLIPTTYKTPPEFSILSDDGNSILETGMVELNSYGNTLAEGLFFSINCLGIRVNPRQALNIRHACEMFVDTDQAIEDPNTGDILEEADAILGSNDIDDELGKQFRDIFINLNSGTTTPSSYSDENINSNFNLNNLSFYDFTSNTNNGVEYISFRGYPVNSSDSFKQPNNSFYMYFGLNPEKSAVDLLNKNYFAECKRPVIKTFFITSETEPDSTGNGIGTIVFTINGGFGPYTYTINGPNGYFINGTIGVEPPILELTGLFQGNYTISVVDLLGNPATHTTFVAGPISLFAVASVTQNNTSLGAQEGQITISGIIGGTAPYFFEITDGLGNPSGTPSSGQITNLPLLINGLATNTTEGYTVLITDSDNNSYQIDGLIVTGFDAITINSVVTPTSCANNNNGSINLSIIGGIPPYQSVTTGPNNFNFTSASQVINLTSLGVGSYTTSVTDSQGITELVTNSVTTQNQPIIINGVKTIPPLGDPFYSIQVFGGQIPYSIEITTLQNQTVFNFPTPLIGLSFLVDSQLNALGGVEYLFQMPFNGIIVKITDNLGCTAQQTIN